MTISSRRHLHQQLIIWLFTAVHGLVARCSPPACPSENLQPRPARVHAEPSRVRAGGWSIHLVRELAREKSPCRNHLVAPCQWVRSPGPCSVQSSSRPPASVARRRSRHIGVDVARPRFARPTGPNPRNTRASPQPGLTALPPLARRRIATLAVAHSRLRATPGSQSGFVQCAVSAPEGADGLRLGACRRSAHPTGPRPAVFG